MFLLLSACVATTGSFNSEDECAVGVMDELARYPRDLFAYTLALIDNYATSQPACLGTGQGPAISSACTSATESYTGTATLLVSDLGVTLAFDGFDILRGDVHRTADGYLSVATGEADNPGELGQDNLQVDITELTQGKDTTCLQTDIHARYSFLSSSFPLDGSGLPDVAVAWSGHLVASVEETTLGTAGVVGDYEEALDGCTDEPETGYLDIAGAPGTARSTYDAHCDGWSTTKPSGAAVTIGPIPLAP